MTGLSQRVARSLWVIAGAAVKIIPPTDLESTLHARGLRHIAGVDEAGRGCLAGPVVAAAVILPSDCALSGIYDSKQMSAKQREVGCALVQEHALAWAVGVVHAPRIDEVNILQAALQAMVEAVESLSVDPDHILIDGRDRIAVRCPQTPVVKGDQRSLSIAAASVIAKVTRDRIMLDAHATMPQYHFDAHKGYGTAAHLAALAEHGVSQLHRKSYAPVQRVLCDN